MMKRSIILNYLGAGLLLMAASACVDEQYTNVPVDGATDSALAEGTFVVDYAVSDGEDSRAFIGEGLEANERIRSLLYLLYDSENMLVKERVIPDINEETTWPLQRTTMTWEQREALKDTLDANSSYTAVFIANADKALFGDRQTDEVLAGKENLSNLVLKLPQTPFADNNMYYFWSGAISYEKPDDAISEDSRDNPVSENIVLRRLVSRIDMEQMEITEEEIKKVIKEGFGDRFDKELTRNLKDLIEQLKLKGDKNDEQFQENCEALEKLLINQIVSKDDSKTVLGGTYTDFINTLLEVCTTEDTDELKNPYNARTALWSNFKTAELKFKDMHNTLSLESLTSSYDGESPTLPTSYVYDLNGGKATWIGFADEGTLADGQSPSMILQGITLSGSTTDGTTGDETGTDTGTDAGEGASGTDNQNTVSLELTFAETPVTISKNGKKTYTCNPIGQISPKELGEGETYGTYEFTVKMSEYCGNGKLEDLLTPKNGFAFGSDTSGDDTSGDDTSGDDTSGDDTSTEPQNTKTDFMNAVSEVFGGWGSSSTSETGVSFSISIPGVGQFSYQATLEKKTTPQGDGSSDDAGNTGNDGGAGGDDTSAGEGAVVP